VSTGCHCMFANDCFCSNLVLLFPFSCWMKVVVIRRLRGFRRGRQDGSSFLLFLFLFIYFFQKDCSLA
jgi:hypothetical protein